MPRLRMWPSRERCTSEVFTIVRASVGAGCAVAFTKCLSCLRLCRKLAAGLLPDDLFCRMANISFYPCISRTEKVRHESSHETWSMRVFAVNAREP